MDRIAPIRRGRPVRLKIGDIADAASVVNAHAALLSEVAAGKAPPGGGTTRRDWPVALSSRRGRIGQGLGNESKMPEATTIAPLSSLREALTADILSRYDRLGRHERYACLSAFDYTKDKLELEKGDFAVWSNQEKVAVAQELMRAAEEFFSADRDGACGAILLSLYLEAQTLPGEHSNAMISIIEDWYHRAIEKEFVPFATKTAAAMQQAGKSVNSWLSNTLARIIPADPR